MSPTARHLLFLPLLLLVMTEGCGGCDQGTAELGPYVGEWNDVDPPEIFDPGNNPGGGCGYYGYGQECPDPEVDCRQTGCVHGECIVNDEDGALCECETGYGGLLCNTCAEGYTPQGDDCILDERDPCSDDPCGADPETQCVVEGAGYRCDCADAFENIGGVCRPRCTLDSDLCEAARLGAPYLVSANGHGAIGYNIEARRVDLFLEHPYRNFDEGVSTRDLLFDTYVGIKTPSTQVWLDQVEPEHITHLDQSGIIHIIRRVGTLRVHTYAFAPWSLSRPALVLLSQVVNEGSEGLDVSIYTLHNYHLGQTTEEDPVNPDDSGERLLKVDETGSYIETGPGGALIHRPIGSPTHTGATPDNPYDLLLRGADLTDVTDSGVGSGRVAGFQKDFVLQPGQSAWFGAVTAFDPFSDVDTLQSDIEEAFEGLDAQSVLSEERASWSAWRIPTPEGLSPPERFVFRQSEAILRQGQVWEGLDKARGQILASMPPGRWNISWARDAVYAIVALARMGHHAEARAGLAFMLEADAGFYEDDFVHVPYQITITRYFGRGREETDFDANGPNIEFDGFGLFLWALGEYTEASGDETLLDMHWPTIRDRIAGALVSLRDGETGLISADSSIWEVHWNGNEKRFTYTSLAAARGLCEAARLARNLQEDSLASQYEQSAQEIRDALVAVSTDNNNVLAGSYEELRDNIGHLDLAVIEAFNWGLFDPEGQIAAGTFEALEANLTVQSGRGFFRNDDGGMYDLQEWVFLDLRAAVAYRRRGDPTRSARLIDWITAQALANEGLIAELHTPDTSTYSGEIPMVGFGAGAYIIALLDRAAQPPSEPFCGTWEPNR